MIEVHLTKLGRPHRVGPRHERLHAIWRAIGGYIPDIDLQIYDAPPGSGHAESFDAIWRLPRTGDLLLLTEFDFLPDLRLPARRWTGAEDLGHYAAVGLPYQTRNAQNKQLISHPGKAAGWFVLLDPRRCPPDLRFAGEPDPCNQLADAVALNVPHGGRDCWPLHFGIEYPYGVHLFWMRHLHDDPDRVVSGCRLGDIQRGHDLAVTRWLATQPADFRRFYESTTSPNPDVGRAAAAAS